jgi:hypothetical protein
MEWEDKSERDLHIWIFFNGVKFIDFLKRV